MGTEGKAGCGCLVFILVISLVSAGILIHPFTLKVIGSQLRYEDKVFPSDAVLALRFTEDKTGELYAEAFHDYSIGNGKMILVENDRLFGVNLVDLVVKIAATRGIKAGAVRGISSEAEGRTKVEKIKRQVEKMGLKKVIVLVPEYSSRRFHILFGSSGQEGTPIYLIKPVAVPYFQKDKWWKEGETRLLVLKEIFAIASAQFERFKYGDKEQTP